VENSEVYENRIVAILDILGITQKINKSVDDLEKQSELFRLFRQRIVKIKKIIGLAFQQYDFKISTFADSIVISAKLDSESQRQFMRAIYLIQIALLRQGEFVRGGIAVGGMHHFEDVYFGKAYLDAHILECENAIYPRVIIDDNFINQLLSTESDIMRYLLDIDKLFKKDIDGFYYVDYIRAIEQDEIGSVKQIVQNNISLNKNNRKIKQKMNWVLTKISELEKQ
jgi:hypothetical protein